jgi:2-dehydro-3-deoxyglucarate aldolase/4-hydroxy-2-oxoheptanedioate aldolase
LGTNIKERLAAGKVVRIFSVGPLVNPKWIEIVAMHGGYHGVWIDEEHAALSQQQIELLALACRASGLDAYVRVAPVNYAAVMRPMEAGINGIMAAQVRGDVEVRQIVQWAKYPPIGCRGLNTSNFEGQWATIDPAVLVEKANRERWLAIQIETVEALAAIDGIAQVEGVDHLFVGPADLSVSLGVPGQFLHPKCLAALERVSAAAKKAHKSWGIFVRGPEHAEACRRLGCQLFALAGDLIVAHAGFRAIRDVYKDFFTGD